MVISLLSKFTVISVHKTHMIKVGKTFRDDVDILKG